MQRGDTSSSSWHFDGHGRVEQPVEQTVEQTVEQRVEQSSNRAIEQSSNRAINDRANGRANSRANSRAIEQSSHRAIEQSSNRAIEPSRHVFGLSRELGIGRRTTAKCFEGWWAGTQNYDGRHRRWCLITQKTDGTKHRKMIPFVSPSARLTFNPTDVTT